MTDENNAIGKSEIEEYYMMRQARENACEQATNAFVFTSDWSRKWIGFLNQSQSVVNQTVQMQDYFPHSTKTALIK